MFSTLVRFSHRYGFIYLVTITVYASHVITQKSDHLSLLLGTPLYADASEFDTRKFGFVMRKVLLPMALDYHIRSRVNDVNAVAAEELSNLNGDVDAFNAAVQVRRRLLLLARKTRKSG